MSDEIRTTATTLTLTDREFIELAKVSKSKFYTLKRHGAFEGLQSGMPGLWSRPKVEAYLSGQQVA